MNQQANSPRFKDEDWKRIKEIFNELSKLEKNEAKQALNISCKASPQIIPIVEKMLAVYFSSSGDTITPTTSAAQTIVNQSLRIKGERFGKYYIVELIGSGGMGQVYVGHRNDEVHQKVAIKLLNLHLIDEDARTRFDIERRVLASLNHPNIARLIDAGHEDGCDYYVMEYVDGIPIDEFCRKHQLSLNARLELFLQVCQAVSVAHNHLIVHRDLKPNNILVTPEGVVKLLDFGIAKPLKSLPGLNDLHKTMAGSAAMTPQYAAPEQIDGDVINVACDVYVLGLLLYLLITDTHAYNLSGMTWGQIENTIKNKVPKPPSKAVKKLYKLNSILQSNAWIKQLKGDLDAIVLHALVKDPNKRYLSVLELKADIERFINWEPIGIKKNHFLYTLKMNIRKHWLPYSLSSIFLVTLLSASWLVWKKSLVAEQERDKALIEMQVSEQVTDFLIDTFKSADPTKVMGKKITAGDVLDQGVIKLDALSSGSQVKNKILTALAEVYINLSDFEKAESLIKQTHVISHDSNKRVVRSAMALATIESERGKNKKAIDVLLQVESLLNVGNDLYFQYMTLKGNLLGKVDDFQSSVKIAEDLLNLAEAQSGKVSLQYAIQLRAYAKAIKNSKNLDQVIALYKDSIQIMEGIGQNSEVTFEVLKTMRFLLPDLINSERYDEALKLASNLEKRYQMIFPENHTVFGHLYTAIGNVYINLGKPELSLDFQKKSRNIYIEAVGENSTRVAFNEINIGAVYLYLINDYMQAKTYYESALRKFEMNNGKTNNFYYMQLPYATCLIKLNMYDEAKTLVEESLAYYQNKEKVSVRNSGLAKSLLAHILIQEGNLNEGRQLLLSSNSIVQKYFADTIHTKMVEGDMSILKIKMREK